MEENNVFLNQEALMDGHVLRMFISQFMREQSKENLFNILYCLRDSYVWIPATYNLTPEQEAQLQKMQKGIKAGEGEGIVFQPDILMDGDSAFLPVFTNEDQVIEEYGENFTRIQKHFLEAMDVADSNAQLTGIVIDAFTVPFTVIKCHPIWKMAVYRSSRGSDRQKEGGISPKCTEKGAICDSV